jgi:hypothetical protein
MIISKKRNALRYWESNPGLLGTRVMRASDVSHYTISDVVLLKEPMLLTTIRYSTNQIVQFSCKSQNRSSSKSLDMSWQVIRVFYNTYAMEGF